MREFEDKYLINGFLCVTPAQYDVLKRMGDDKPIDLFPPASPPVGGITVLVIKPGEQRDVGGGWHAINWDGQIYGISELKMKKIP